MVPFLVVFQKKDLVLEFIGSKAGLVESFITNVHNGVPIGRFVAKIENDRKFRNVKVKVALLKLLKFHSFGLVIVDSHEFCHFCKVFYLPQRRKPLNMVRFEGLSHITFDFFAQNAIFIDTCVKFSVFKDFADQSYSFILLKLFTVFLETNQPMMKHNSHSITITSIRFVSPKISVQNLFVVFVYVFASDSYFNTLEYPIIEIRKLNRRLVEVKLLSHVMLRC